MGVPVQRERLVEVATLVEELVLVGIRDVEGAVSELVYGLYSQGKEPTSN